eukprot:ANDGO_02482.mRNA.1 variant
MSDIKVVGKSYRPLNTTRTPSMSSLDSSVTPTPSASAISAQHQALPSAIITTRTKSHGTKEPLQSRKAQLNSDLLVSGKHVVQMNRPSSASSGSGDQTSRTHADTVRSNIQNIGHLEAANADAFSFNPHALETIPVSASQVALAANQIAENVVRNARLNSSLGLSSESVNGIPPADSVPAEPTMSVNSSAGQWTIGNPALIPGSPIQTVPKLVQLVQTASSSSSSSSSSFNSASSSLHSSKLLMARSLKSHFRFKLAKMVAAHWRSFARKRAVKREHLLAWHGYVWAHKHDVTLNVIAATKCHVSRMAHAFASWQRYVDFQREKIREAARFCLIRWRDWSRKCKVSMVLRQKWHQRKQKSVVRDAFLRWAFEMHQKEALLKRRLFRSWRRRVLWNKEGRSELASHVFDAWRHFAHKRGRFLFLVSNVVFNIRSAFLIRTCWAFWKHRFDFHKKVGMRISRIREGFVKAAVMSLWSRIVAMRRLQIVVAKDFRLRCLKKAYLIWRRKQTKLLLERDYQGSLRADLCYQRILLRRSLRMLSQYALHSQQKREKLRFALHYGNRLTMHRVIRAWIEFRRVQHEDEFKEHLADQHYQRAIKRVVIRSLKSYADGAVDRERKMRAAIRFMANNASAKALRTWKWYALEHRRQCRRNNEAARMFRLESLFSSWFSRARDAGTQRLTYTRLRLSFMKWMQYHRECGEEKLLMARAEMHHCKAVLKACLKRIGNYSVRRRIVHGQYAAADSFSDHNLRREAFVTWKEAFMNNVRLRKNELIAEMFGKEKELLRSFRSWKVYVRSKREKVSMIAKAEKDFKCHLFKVGVLHWLKVAAASRSVRLQAAEAQHAIRATAAMRRVDMIARHWRQLTLKRRLARSGNFDGARTPSVVSPSLSTRPVEKASSSIGIFLARPIEPSSSFAFSGLDVRAEEEAIRQHDYQMFEVVEKRRRERLPPKPFSDDDPAILPAPPAHTAREPAFVTPPQASAVGSATSSNHPVHSPTTPSTTAAAAAPPPVYNTSQSFAPIQQKTTTGGLTSSLAPTPATPSQDGAPVVRADNQSRSTGVPKRGRSQTPESARGPPEELRPVVATSPVRRRPPLPLQSIKQVDQDDEMADVLRSADVDAIADMLGSVKRRKDRCRADQRRLAELLRRREAHTQLITGSLDDSEDSRFGDSDGDGDDNGSGDSDDNDDDNGLFRSVVSRNSGTSSSSRSAARWGVDDERAIHELRGRIREYRSWRRKKEPLIQELVAIATQMSCHPSMTSL